MKSAFLATNVTRNIGCITMNTSEQQLLLHLIATLKNNANSLSNEKYRNAIANFVVVLCDLILRKKIICHTFSSMIIFFSFELLP